MAGKRKHADCFPSTDKEVDQKKRKQNYVAKSDTKIPVLYNETEVKRKNCMKHKKKDKSAEKKKVKKHHKQNKKDKVTEHSNPSLQVSMYNKKGRIQLPKVSSEISANWKLLLKQSVELKEERRRAKKKKKKLIRKKELSPPPTAKDESKTPDIWFDDVDEILIEGHKSMKNVPLESSDLGEKKEEKDRNPLVKPDSFAGPTKTVAMDCEMVGVGDEGKESILARVSLVNQYGQCIYDKFVKPSETVTDYRTSVSGVRPEDLAAGDEFKDVQKDVFNLIQGRTLVGHALHNDMKVLYLDHPHKMIRDTSTYKPFRALFKGRRPALRKLSDQVLKVPIQTGEHSSVQDAQAAMRLYTMYRKQWEKELQDLHSSANRRKTKKKKSPAAK